MVLLASTFFGGSVLTSTCCASRSLMVGGFLFAAWPGDASSRATAAALNPLDLAREYFTASPWACRWRRDRESRGPAGIGSAASTHPPSAAAGDPCDRAWPERGRRRHQY